MIISLMIKNGVWLMIFKELIIEILVGMKSKLMLFVSVVFIFLIFFNLIVLVYNNINNNIKLIIDVGIGIGINDLIIFDIKSIKVIIMIWWKKCVGFDVFFCCFMIIVFYVWFN